METIKYFDETIKPNSRILSIRLEFDILVNFTYCKTRPYFSTVLVYSHIGKINIQEKQSDETIISQNCREEINYANLIKFLIMHNLHFKVDYQNETISIKIPPEKIVQYR